MGQVNGKAKFYLIQAQELAGGSRHLVMGDAKLKPHLKVARTLFKGGVRQHRRQRKFGWIIPTFIIGSALILAVCLGGGRGGRQFFCVKCGLVQHDEHLSLFDIPVFWRTEYWPTSYNALYTSVFPSPCSHQWRLSSEYGGSFLGHAWVSCGAMPFTSAFDALAVQPLSRLKNRGHLALILSTFDFIGVSARSHKQLQTVEELRNFPDEVAQDVWWARNQNLLISPSRGAGEPIHSELETRSSVPAHR